MSTKNKAVDDKQPASTTLRSSRQRTQPIRQRNHPDTIAQRALLDPNSLTPQDMNQLQRTIGNQMTGQLLAQVNVQRTPGEEIQVMSRISTIQRGIIPPVDIPIEPNLYRAATNFNWAVGASGSLGSLQVIALNHNDPQLMNSPMRALVIAGQQTIYYDPVVCGNMGPQAAYYVLIHELAHHQAGHDTDPTYSSVSQIEKERHADDTASLNIIKNMPNITQQIFQGIYTYFANINNHPGSATHPSDAVRAKRIEQLWSFVEKLKGNIVINNNDRITEDQAKGALIAIGHNPVDTDWLQAKMIEAANTGQMLIPKPNTGTSMTYTELADALTRLDQFEQANSITFNLNIQWDGLTPEGIFTILNQPENNPWDTGNKDMEVD